MWQERSFNIFLILYIGISVLCPKQGLTENPKTSAFIRVQTSLESIAIWWRGIRGDRNQAVSLLESKIPLLQNHWVFKDNLPGNWAVLLDGYWNKTSGYGSKNLTDPQRRPALLLSPPALLEPNSGTSLLIHEMTHLIHYRLRPREENWIREGVALLAEPILNRHLRSPVRLNPLYEDGLRSPESSLTEISDLHDGSEKTQSQRASQYGNLLLYFQYLYRLCGRESFFKTLAESPSEQVGIAHLDSVLKEMSRKPELRTHPICASFEDSFKAFEIARFKQDFTDPASFLFPKFIKIPLRDKPIELPPYSATVYQIGEGESCPKGDTAWGATRCIRIRLE